MNEPHVPAHVDSICFAFVGADRVFLVEPSSPITSARDTALMSESRALGFVSKGLRQLPAAGNVNTVEKALRCLSSTSTRAGKASVRTAFL